MCCGSGASVKGDVWCSVGGFGLAFEGGVVEAWGGSEGCLSMRLGGYNVFTAGDGAPWMCLST
jgi:hypothetical protein